MTDSVLVYGDTDSVKDYVFEASTLTQMRGGSQLLLNCEDEVRRIIQAYKGQGAREVYCGGGTFLFYAPTSAVEEIRKAIEAAYHSRTLTATVTVVREEGPPSIGRIAGGVDGWAGRLVRGFSGQTDGGFAHRVALLGARLREAKTHRRCVPFLESFSVARPCDVCGKRMATGEVVRRSIGSDNREERLLLCPVCHRRHESGAAARGGIRGRFNREFRDFLSEAGDGQTVQAPDLDGLVAGARRSYVALLYADGNDIGDLLGHLSTETEYATVSLALHHATRQALFSALLEVCTPDLRRRRYWPFEIVNIGGDDITVLIEGAYAWRVGVAFLRAFEDLVRKEVETRLGRWPGGWPDVTACIGIAVADVRYPVRYLFRLAQDLLRSAKRLAKQDRSRPRSCLDFLWLPDPIASEEVEPLMARYRTRDCSLTARPYTLPQAEELLKLALVASRWPRSRRHQWAQVLERGVLAAANFVLYSVARCRDAQEREKLTDFLRRVGALSGTSSNVPGSFWGWRSDARLYQTALLDVLELAEMVAFRPDDGEEGRIP